MKINFFCLTLPGHTDMYTKAISGLWLDGRLKYNNS